MRFENPFKSSGNKTRDKSPLDTSRRDFLKYGAISAVSIASSAVVGEIIGSELAEIKKGKNLEDYKLDFKELVNQAELTEKVLELQQQMRDRYGIDVLIDQEDLDLTSVKTLRSKLELRLIKQAEALTILSQELLRYPDFMIKQYGLSRIVLTSKLRHKNTSQGGYVLPGNIDSQIEELTPELVLHYDWNSNYLIPNVEKSEIDKLDLSDDEKNDLIRRSIDAMFRRVIHHELSHYMIDVPTSEQTPRNEEVSLIKKWDDKFKDVNSDLRSFFTKNEAGIDGANETEQDSKSVSNNIIGVVREYGLNSEFEDRATTAEAIMLGEHEYRESSDVILAEKLSVLREYYYDASCGLMDSFYWKNLVSGGDNKMVQNYFQEKALIIIETPYSNFEDKDKVSEGKYEKWQNILKHTNLVKSEK